MSDTLSLSPSVLRKLQLKELESITYFDDFCRRNQLRYYLLGGCVIGALRHGGFIPWDDDIDVIMPRKDYMQLLKLWYEQESGERFKLLYPDGEIITHNPFATLVDTSIKLIKDNQKDLDIPRGIVTDIFPIDGCPDGKIQRYMQYYHAMIYSLYSTEVVPENHGAVVKLAGKLLLSLVRSKKARARIFQKAEKKLSRYDFETHEWCTELYAGPHYMLNKYPQKAFAEAEYRPFEDLSLPLPKGYDVYLKTAFGEYMELPPEEKRVPHHDLSYLDIDAL